MKLSFELALSQIRIFQMFFFFFSPGSGLRSKESGKSEWGMRSEMKSEQSITLA